MANGYVKKFTLQKIFNNPALAGKLPLVNYKETKKENGKTTRTTNMKSVTTLVYDSAVLSAKPYYKPLRAVRGGNRIEIGGNLIGDHETAVNAVYKGILAQVPLIRMTANCGEIIRSALKDGVAQKKSGGKEPKLWLKVGSMLEIKTMNKRQLEFLLDDILRNIFYNPEFEKTQQKFNVSQIAVNGSQNYERRRDNWLRKVGEL